MMSTKYRSIVLAAACIQNNLIDKHAHTYTIYNVYILDILINFAESKSEKQTCIYIYMYSIYTYNTNTFMYSINYINENQLD